MAMAAAQHGKRSGRRGEHAWSVRRVAREKAGKAAHLQRIAAGDDHRGKAAERRRPAVPPLSQLLGIQLFLVAGGQRLHHRMPGQMGVASRPLLAGGPVRDLIEQLNAALGGA
jgi:hypothetical protein